MLLKELTILNCRKVVQAKIEFHGAGLQIISGANASGKTTIVQAIQLLLEGTKAFTPGMITFGQTQAEIIGLTDDGLKIRTQISGDGVKQTVSKLDEESGRYTSVSGGVREFLEGIRSGFEMPWSMRDMSDAKIIEILKDRCGITQKINEIDAELSDKERSRLETGRDKKALGDIGEAPAKVDHPPKIDEIKTKREAATAYLKKVNETLEKAANYIKEKCVFASIDDISGLHKAVDSAIKCAQDKIKDDVKYTQADLEKFDREYSNWVEIENKAVIYDTYVEKKTKLDSFTAEYEKLTAEIEELRASRKKVLSEMNLGVKGLEISEENQLIHNGAIRGVTDKNKVSNWSTAESVKVFFSIAARFSSEMKVIVVDNAESLDSATVKAISDWSDKNQFLVLLLKVAEMPENLEDGIIYVKDGEVILKGAEK
jgi:predicted ATP-dependent endonuclease of OLD family